MRRIVLFGLIPSLVLALAVLAGGGEPAYAWIPPAAWAPPAALNTNAYTDSGIDEYPQVTTDGGGNWVAVWDSNENLSGTIGADRDILVARSTDSGATWTAPAALNANAHTDSGDDGTPQVTTDGAGNWVAVWRSDENLGGTIGPDKDILVARSTDNGDTWTAPAALNANAHTDSGDDWYPQVTTDGAGNWVAVWHSVEDLGGTIGGDWDILVSGSTDNGLIWTPPAALNTNADTDLKEDEYPQVTTDGWGNWVAVWMSAENLDGAIGTDWDILVARSTDSGVNWTDPDALNANADTDAGADNRPQVTTDGWGNWVAVWYSDENLGGAIGTDNDILVARSTDSGANWTDPDALNANADTDAGADYDPQVATEDGWGNNEYLGGPIRWVAVWHSSENLDGAIGTDFDILVARSTDSGANWTDPDALNANADTDAGADNRPQVATDGGGNWVAVWSSLDSLGATIETDRDILYTTWAGQDVYVLLVNGIKPDQSDQWEAVVNDVDHLSAAFAQEWRTVSITTVGGSPGTGFPWPRDPEELDGRIAAAFGPSGANDLCIFYLGTHGFQLADNNADEGDGLDGGFQIGERWRRDDNIDTPFNASLAAGDCGAGMLLMFMTCYSGELIDGGTSDFDLEPPHVVTTSCTSVQESRTCYLGHLHSCYGGNGLVRGLTSVSGAGLARAGDNSDTGVTAAELHTYARDHDDDPTADPRIAPPSPPSPPSVLQALTYAQPAVHGSPVQQGEELFCNSGPLEPEPVGGITELFVDGSEAAPSAAHGSGSSSPPYAVIAGASLAAAAALVALTAGGWYARRRLLR